MGKPAKSPELAEGDPMMRVGLNGRGIGPAAQREQHHRASPSLHRIGDRKRYRPGTANDAERGAGRRIDWRRRISLPSRFLLRAGAGAANRIGERPRAAANESENAADQPVACAFSLDPRQPVAKQAVAEK